MRLKHNGTTSTTLLSAERGVGDMNGEESNGIINDECRGEADIRGGGMNEEWSSAECGVCLNHDDTTGTTYGKSFCHRGHRVHGGCQLNQECGIRRVKGEIE